MIEKRNFTRISKEALVSYDKIAGGTEVVEEGMAKTKDLSVGGIHLQLPCKVDPGDTLKLTLNLDGHMVSLQGAAVWCEANGDIFETGVAIQKVPQDYLGLMDTLSPES